MFTPPPSPGQSPTLQNHEQKPEDENVDPISRIDTKRRIGRRARWSVFLVPVILILITASTRYITHPRALDVFEAGVSQLLHGGGDWTSHPPHLRARQATGPTPVSSAPSATTTAGTAQPLPSVPSSPPTLPTPFPQPFDADFTQNFSSVSCYNFFTNMTNTAPFRSCRPFSLLLQGSAAMIDAQTNLTLMNSIVWGTCNTTVPEDQCVANFAWFTKSLQDSCSADLKDRNTKATETLVALEAYEVMRQAGCQIDPTTNTYCYVAAVHNQNPSDLYYYNLPLGKSLPNTAKSSCNACTKSLMGIYGDALKGGTTLTGLKETYNDAAQQAIQDCGQAYATLAASGASLRASSSSVFVTLVATTILSLWFIIPL